MARPKKGEKALKEKKAYTIEEILTALQLPIDDNGRAEFDRLMDSFPKDFTYDDKLFLLLYLKPSSRLCHKLNQSIFACGRVKSYASYILNKPNVKEFVEQFKSKAILDDLKETFQKDIEYNKMVLAADRTQLWEDVEFTDDNGDSHSVLLDKKLDNLKKQQRMLIRDKVYDSRGRAHYETEKRSEARTALLNYYKLFNQDKPEEKQTNSTEIILENIKDKAIAKVKIIQNNDIQAAEAGEFFEKPADASEEL